MSVRDFFLHVGSSRRICLGHIVPYAFRFFFMQVRFTRPMYLKHILSYASVIVYFSLYESGFFDSSTSYTFYLVPLPHWNSLYTDHIFSTHIPWAHFILYFRYNRFLFTRVRFSRLTYLEHILSYASTVIDFSLCGLSFLYSCVLSTFYLTTAMVDFSLRRLGFHDSYTSRKFILCLCFDEFLFTWVRFYQLIHIEYILSCAFAMTISLYAIRFF